MVSGMRRSGGWFIAEDFVLLFPSKEYDLCFIRFPEWISFHKVQELVSLFKYIVKRKKTPL